MNLNIPALNLETESQGKWFDYLGGIRLRIARMNNDEYLEAAVLKYSEVTGNPEETSEKFQEKFVIELYAKYILKEWEGVKDGDSEIPYEPVIGESVLSDPKYKDMLSFVLRKSRDTAQFWEEKTVEVGEK